jgi:phospholipid transport system substrate-binding protein
MMKISAVQPNAIVLRRRSLFRGLAVLGAIAWTGTGHAQPAPAPEIPVERFDAALLSIMKAGRQAPFRQRFEMLAPAVDQTFDLETILRNSVGLSWSNLPANQRSALLDTFRRYTIASWVANFDSWSGEEIRISPQPRKVGNDVVVATRISSPNGSPTDLSYVMRQGPGGWKVVDVLADGSISRVAVQRSDFRALLARGGVHALEASLQQKISSLSHGALA